MFCYSLFFSLKVGARTRCPFRFLPDDQSPVQYDILGKIQYIPFLHWQLMLLLVLMEGLSDILRVFQVSIIDCQRKKARISD
jgi:hypothetical protein